jgi:hypothetical protein
MRSTQVAAAWVPSLFQGPDTHSTNRHKFLKLLISNNISSSSMLSPSSFSPKDGESSVALASKSESAKSDDSSSGEDETGSSFSSPEAVQSVSAPTKTGHASLVAPQLLSSEVGNGLQDVLLECRGAIQVCLQFLQQCKLAVVLTAICRPFSNLTKSLNFKCLIFKLRKRLYHQPVLRISGVN